MGNKKQDWYWLDDLNCLLLHTLVPILLIVASVLGGKLGLTAEERASAGSIAGYLVRMTNVKTKGEEKDSGETTPQD